MVVVPDPRRKNEQQPEGVCVSLASVQAVASLGRHLFAQECSDQRGDRRQATPSAISTSAAVAISVINPGVASRYQ